MKMFRKDEGFTLVELMVVVLIIGILVAIAVPIFNAAKANAQKNSCWANERTVEGAWQAYLASGAGAGTTPDWAGLTGAAGVLIPDYVKSQPTCGAGGTYSATYDGDAVTISCTEHATHP